MAHLELAHEVVNQVVAVVDDVSLVDREDWRIIRARLRREWRGRGLVDTGLGVALSGRVFGYGFDASPVHAGV